MVAAGVRTLAVVGPGVIAGVGVASPQANVRTVKKIRTVERREEALFTCSSTSASDSLEVYDGLFARLVTDVNVNVTIRQGLT